MSWHTRTQISLTLANTRFLQWTNGFMPMLQKTRRWDEQQLKNRLIENLEHRLKEEGVQVANVWMACKTHLDICFLLAQTRANRER